MPQEVIFIFTVKQEHINLLKRMSVSWEETKSDPTHPGAPAIHRGRTYGNSNIEGDLAEILELPSLNEDEYEDEDEIAEKTQEEKEKEAEKRRIQKDYMDCMHRETEYALQICLIFGKIEPGTYASPYPVFTHSFTTLLSEEKLRLGIARAKKYPEKLEMIKITMQKNKNGIIDWKWSDATKEQ